MLKKKYIPAHNCTFHVGKGNLTIYPTLDFSMRDLLKTWKMAKMHAKRKKIKRPEQINNWRKCVITIPTLAA